MVELVGFIAEQFFNFIMWLDDIKIIGTLTLLRVLIIATLFMIGLKFLKGGKND